MNNKYEIGTRLRWGKVCGTVSNFINNNDITVRWGDMLIERTYMKSTLDTHTIILDESKRVFDPFIKKTVSMKSQIDDIYGPGTLDRVQIGKESMAKCDCGSEVTYGKDCGTHSDWCRTREVV